MRHTHPPAHCWCGTRHTPGQAFDLNVYGRELSPGTCDDAAIEGIREMSAQPWDLAAPDLDAVRTTLDGAGFRSSYGGSPGFDADYDLISGDGRTGVRVWHAGTAQAGTADYGIEILYAAALEDAGFPLTHDDQPGVLVTGRAMKGEPGEPAD